MRRARLDLTEWDAALKRKHAFVKRFVFNMAAAHAGVNRIPNRFRNITITGLRGLTFC